MEVEIRFKGDQYRQPISCHLDHLPDVDDSIIVDDAAIPYPYKVESRIFYLKKNKVTLFVK